MSDQETKNTQTKNKAITLGASKAHQWMNCPGSVEFQKRNIQNPLGTEDKEASKGTDIHKCAEMVLLGVQRLDQYKEELEPEDFEQLNFYINSVDYLSDGGHSFFVETRHSFENRGLQIVSIMDSVFQDSNGTWNICDLKTGWADVDAEDNEQLYISALLLAYNVGLNDTEIIGRIIQPTQKKIDTTYIKIKDPEKQLIEILDKYVGSQDQLNPGPHCKYCKVNDICPELTKKLKIYLEPQFQDPKYLMDRPTIWAEFLDYSKVIEKLAEKVRSETIRLLKLKKENPALGYDVPGYELASKNGQRTWSDKTLSASKLAEMLDLNEEDMSKISLQSPAQVEKIIKSRFKDDKEHRVEVEEKFKGLVGQPLIYYPKRVKSVGFVDTKD